MLKGVDTINNILNKFLEPFECTAEIGDDFCYWSTSSVIDYALVVAEKSDAWFIEFANELMPSIKCDIFLLSFFHELGHHETIDDIDDDTYNYCLDMKAEISSSLENERELNFRYFNLPDEKAATEWGLHYMANHVSEVTALWNELQPAIMNFYRLNNIH